MIGIEYVKCQAQNVSTDKYETIVTCNKTP